MIDKAKVLCSVACLLVSSAAMAIAGEPDWHWDVFGTSSYSGSVSLRDDQNASLSFQRNGSSSNPTLFGSNSVQAPLMVVAGTDLKIDIARSGLPVTKEVCTGGKTLKVFASPVTLCDNGVANNIQGFHVSATDDVTTFTPTLWIYTTPAGWHPINNHPCGNLEIKQVCELP